MIATASTGNAASSLSAMCGGSGGKLRAVVFAPASAPEPKIVQMLMYGAGVVLVKVRMCSWELRFFEIFLL